MNKWDWIESFLFAGFRIVAFVFILVGLLGLIFQLMDGWHQFDPNYLGAFILHTLARPLIVMFTGVLLHYASGFLSRKMSAHHHRSST